MPYNHLQVQNSALLMRLFQTAFERKPQLIDGSMPTYDRTPCKIEIIDGAKPFFAGYAKTKRFEAPQMEALQQWLRKGLKSGLVRPNPSSTWGSPVVCAPKPQVYRLSPQVA